MSNTGVSGMITLTTDFGTADGYVGAMKGRMLSIAPRATLVDISHQVEPQQVVQGAWCLRRAVQQFPPGVVHLAVVDPGVGSERAAVIVELRDGWLVGPDNGLLALVAEDLGVESLWAIGENPPERSRSGSFDGLTLFAPTAARLATGVAPGELGDPLQHLAPLDQPQPEPERGRVTGEILFFDRFGNAITNIPCAMIPGEAQVQVHLPSGGVLRLFSHYSAIPVESAQGHAGPSGAVWNSDGLLELASFSGSFRQRSGLTPGAQIVATWA